jgi:hypothetical protein
VVAVPKTMDNDVFGTDYCIGFSTAVTRSVQFIHQLRTAAGSHAPSRTINWAGIVPTGGTIPAQIHEWHDSRPDRVALEVGGQSGGICDGR